MVTPEPSTAAACVFCGRPIEPGEAMAGRAPMAAHASCADAALASDEHWDAVSDASSGEPGASGLDRTPRVGCLGVSSGLLLATVAIAIARGRGSRAA